MKMLKSPENEFGSKNRKERLHTYLLSTLCITKGSTQASAPVSGVFFQSSREVAEGDLENDSTELKRDVFRRRH